MELWLATSNSGKINEIRNLLSDLPIEVKTQNELEVYSSPEETGDSFKANAVIKSKSLASVKNGVWVLADDSGLVCEGLDGMPGIHSARYAGEKARDSENVAKLLKMIQLRTTNRNAAFICHLSVISPDGNLYDFEGKVNGSIAPKQSGASGFGYDPVFIPEGYEKTMAELSPAEKNKISHRAQALRLFKEELRKHL